MKRRILYMALGAAVWLAGTGTVAAQTESSTTTLGFGLRAGLGLDPDQFVMGGQFSIGQRYGVFRVVPSVDVGLGSDVTTIDFNGDLLVRLNIEGSNLSLYGGGGPTVAYWDSDAGDGSWEFGASLVAGARLPIRVLTSTSLEARFGLGDVPDLRLLVGLAF